MLTVEQISKRYGHRTALREVYFTAETGEIIALLGRNGAGKTTLMNILTGYIAMTSGRAFIGGYDVLRDPLAARRLVGYLPELPPLYPEMTVRECLAYCAALKGLPRGERRKEMDRVISLTALEAYAGRLSGRLSKGYRQRVGLAQALLGRPPLLILDEPGSGLDPVQLAQMRDVIRNVGRESTVLLSSHLLSEVTNVCARALVLDAGRLRYDGPMEELTVHRGVLEVAYRNGRDMKEALSALPEVSRMCTLEEGTERTRLALYCADSTALAAEVAQCVLARKGELLALCPQHEGLEDAFLRLIHEEAKP